MFHESFDTYLLQIRASHEKSHGSERGAICIFDDESVVAASYDLEIFCTVNMNEYNYQVKIWKFSGFI